MFIFDFVWGQIKPFPSLIPGERVMKEKTDEHMNQMKSTPTLYG